MTQKQERCWINIVNVTAMTPCFFPPAISCFCHVLLQNSNLIRKYLASNGTQFPFVYSLKNSTGIIKKIYYGDKLFIEDEHGISPKGSIDLNGFSSPIVFIKSKIVLSEDGKEFIDYGKGCYCGAVDFSEVFVEKSKIHNAVK
jgi:hypothetical protein